MSAHNHLGEGPKYYGIESGCCCDKDDKAIYGITLAKVSEGNILILGEGRLFVHGGAQNMPEQFITKPHETLMLSFAKVIL